VRYTLLVTEGPDQGLTHTIRSRELTVGRSAEMELILTDPAVLPRHFVVSFDQGGWRATTYEPRATILIDRRWHDAVTGQRGARIFVGQSQLLLVPGDDIDLDRAKRGSAGLDIDEETLRDDALTTVGNEAYEFRHDMKGKAARVNDDKRRTSRRRLKNPSGYDDSATMAAEPAHRPSMPSAPSTGAPPPVLNSTGGGMMRLPVPVDPRRAGGQSARSTGSNSWGDSAPRVGGAAAQSQNSGEVPRSRALAKGQTISLTDTAIGAMPSSSRDLWVLYEKDGPFASELRILATRLEDMKGTFGYKTFLFTSINQGEGKTVVASNLALAMSEDSERKIALVDANFRSPRAGDLFNLDKERGILSAISGERPLSECVARVIGRNLIVLNAGGLHNNPAQVLSDPKFKTLLSELSQAVDFMIVDAPSAVPFADVPLLAQHVDAVFMVVGANGTKSGQLDKAVETIGRNRVVGAIFVNAPTKKKKKKK
jgi:capsular exopolysaccharide synthesis family protein